MKDNLKSLTFLLLVRIDTIQRLENTMIVVELLCRYFDTNVMVREAGLYNNNILASLLKKKVKYEFVEDLDPILHKTRHVFTCKYPIYGNMGCRYRTRKKGNY